MDLVHFLRTHKVAVRQAGEHHHVRGGWAGVDCPFCSPGTRRFRLGVNLATGAVSCWTCGKHSLRDTLRRLTGTAPEGLDFAPRDDAPRGGTLTVPEGVGPLLRQHRKYLIKRGFDPDEVESLWGVGGIGIAPRLSWRLYIPIHHDGEVVSWTTRGIADGGQNHATMGVLRYVNAKVSQESLGAKECLYGAYNAKHAVVVHEGCTDVWATGPGAVATMGLTYTESQVLMLSRYLVRAVCFDNEPAAQARARRLCARLELFPGETLNVVLSGKDAASSPKAELRELRARFLH